MSKPNIVRHTVLCQGQEWHSSLDRHTYIYARWKAKHRCTKSFIIMVKSKTQAYKKFYNNGSNKNENEPLIKCKVWGSHTKNKARHILCACVCVCIYACICVYAGALCCSCDVPNKLEHMGYFVCFFSYRCQINSPMGTINLLKNNNKKPLLYNCV